MVISPVSFYLFVGKTMFNSARVHSHIEIFSLAFIGNTNPDDLITIVETAGVAAPERAGGVSA